MWLYFIHPILTIAFHTGRCKHPQNILRIFSLKYPLYIIFIFTDTGYWINLPYCIISFSVENIKILFKISFQLKTVKNITYPVFSSVSYLTKEKNIRNTPDHSLYKTAILFSLFFIWTILCEQNPWFWPKKVKNKIRIKPSLLSHRILEQSVWASHS